MKILNGTELTDYIKERQLRQSRGLRQSWRTVPRLAILRTGENAVVDLYLRLKKSYGSDIEVQVDEYTVADADLLSQIAKLNADDSVHGIIVQLPLADVSMTDAAVTAVTDSKDVDGLGDGHIFTPATAMAIDWLLAGYNVNLADRPIAIVGKGRLVGAPLATIWRKSGYDVLVCDTKTADLVGTLQKAEVIVSAAGVPGLITSDMIQRGAVVVDAGTASEDGKVVGDLAADVRDREDLIITPIRGGVGPLTIAALFDNLLAAARTAAEKTGQQDI